MRIRAADSASDERSRTPPRAAIARPRSPWAKRRQTSGLARSGLQVVHVDAVLAEQRQHVLAGLDQLRGAAVGQRPAQGAEAFGILGGLGEVQRPDEILGRDRGRRRLGRGAQLEAGLVARRGGGRGGQHRGRLRFGQRRGLRIEAKVAIAISVLRWAWAISSSFFSNAGRAAGAADLASR